MVTGGDLGWWGPGMVDTATPYSGPLVGELTPSGLRMPVDGELIVPNDQFQKIKGLVGRMGAARKRAAAVWNTSPRAILPATRRDLWSAQATAEWKDAHKELYAASKELTKYDDEAFEARCILRGTTVEKERERWARESARARRMQKQDARSRFDFAGGSEDEQGIDYTTLEGRMAHVRAILGG